MTENRMYAIIRKYGICYMAVVAAVLAMKLYYCSAGIEKLQWIMAPTAWWAGILSGVEFAYESQIGYVSHSIRFIIAPSCSGIQFMTVVFAVLAGAFAYRMKTGKGQLCWMAGCAAAAVLLTVFVNGIRIALSVYLPGVVRRFGLGLGWLNPEQLHTVTGAVVYIAFLIVIYGVADWILCKMEGSTSKPAGWIVPVLVYFLIVLGIPLLNGALKDNREQFIGYASLVAAACVFVFCIFRGAICLWKLFKRNDIQPYGETDALK